MSNVSVPEDIPVPSLVSETATSVLVVWTEPGSPNGNILQYGIERRLPGTEEVTLLRTFLRTDPREYTDESVDISPNTAYEYRIAVENSAGRAVGPWAQVTTRPSRKSS